MWPLETLLLLANLLTLFALAVPLPRVMRHQSGRAAVQPDQSFAMRMASDGRQCEVANRRFVELRFAKMKLGRTARRRKLSGGSGCTTSHQVGFSRGVLP